VDKARSVVQVHRDAVARAIDAGVKIAMGPDSGLFDHGRNTDELELLVKAGMAPADALVAATSSAADLLCMGDRIGRIAPGRRADLTIVSGDPYDFAGYRDRIAYVLRDGRVVRNYRPTPNPAPRRQPDLTDAGPRSRERTPT
jgi:imidazolonepropionase-like amidohydrolase